MAEAIPGSPIFRCLRCEVSFDGSKVPDLLAVLRASLTSYGMHRCKDGLLGHAKLIGGKPDAEVPCG